MQILHIPQDALVIKIIATYLELHVSYNWLAMPSKLSSKYFTFSFGHFFGFSHNNCLNAGGGVYSQATPGATECTRYRLEQVC